MDDSVFDRYTRILGATPSRRTALSLIVGAACGGLGRLLHGADVDARGKKSKSKKKGGIKDRSKGKSKGKSKKKGKKPAPPQSPPQSPPPWRPCSGCNACQKCVEGEGRCVPDPSKNGMTCGGCHTCNNGACNAPNDALCRSDQRCQPGVGLCCPECQSDGSCCPFGSICINPGLLTPNFCCDTEFFDFCGGNGDGTFKECCPRSTHRCLDDQCVPRGECPDGWKLCPGRTEPHCAPEDFVCCGNSSCNPLNVCCDASKDVCCVQGHCAGTRCCSENWGVCGTECCNPHIEACCGGTDCCHPNNCVGGTCCPRGVCGGPNTVSHVCPTEDEFCCQVDPRNPNHGGYACPRGNEDNGAPDCALGGRCCPAGTLYDEECDACCVKIFALHCQDRQCVPPTPGRFP